MGMQYTHALGHLQRLGLIAESTPGTYVPPTASDFIKVKSSTIGMEIAREVRDDANEGFDPYELITGKSNFTFSFDTLVFTSNALGTAGILGRAIQAVLGGTPTVSGGVSVTYGLSNSQGLGSWSLLRNANAPSGTSITQDQLAGCVFDSWKVNAPGSEKPTFSFGGRAISHVGVGTTAVASDGGAGTTAALTSPTGRYFDIGGRVQIGAQTNTTGFVVGGTQAAASITVAPAHAGVTTGDVIRPFCPTPTYQAGTAIGHTEGTFTMDSVAIKVTGLELEVKKNLDYIDDEHGVPGMSDATPKMRDIIGAFSFRARQDVIGELTRWKNFESRALNFQIGATATRIWEFQLPQVELLITGMDLPQTGSGMIKVPFRAKASTPGALDALTVVQR